MNTVFRVKMKKIFPFKTFSFPLTTLENCFNFIQLSS